MEPATSADVIARRAGAPFAGFALMLFLVRTHPPSPSRNVVASGFALTRSLVAVLGTVSFLTGTTGPMILLAVLVAR